MFLFFCIYLITVFVVVWFVPTLLIQKSKYNGEIKILEYENTCILYSFFISCDTAVLKKHWWKHNEQKKLFSQYGFWTWNNLKYPKLKCFGEGFYNIFIFEGFFSIILLIFARYSRYLKLPTLQWKSFEKIKISKKPSPRHFILGYFKSLHVQKPYLLNSFFCSLFFHQCFFKTAVG